MTDESKLEKKPTEFASTICAAVALRAKIVGPEVHLLLGKQVYILSVEAIVELASFATVRFAEWADQQPKPK